MASERRLEGAQKFHDQRLDILRLQREKSWVLHSADLRREGRSLTETNILRRINGDTFTWQSIDRHLGDETLPDLAPVKVTRVKL